MSLLNTRLAKAALAWSNRTQALYNARNPTYHGTSWSLAKFRSRSKDLAPQNGDGVGLIGPFPNDHMAIRTFSTPGFGIDILGQALESVGYEPRDTYVFETKKLDAQWFAPPPDTMLPRVFLSQLRVHELSSSAQATLRLHLCEHRPRKLAELLRQHASTRSAYEKEPINAEHGQMLNMTAYTYGLSLADMLDEKLYSSVISQHDYEKLRAETEYGAWTLLNGNRINHCTIPIRWLAAPLDSMYSFVKFARKELALDMNDNGAVQQSEDGLLLQSSTVAVTYPFLFRGAQSPTAVPGSFVEFIERRREGFEAANADKIFESTDAEKSRVAK